jgi:putative transposase
MPQCQAGEYLFVTIYTHDREPLLQDKQAKRLLLNRLSDTKKQFRLVIAAYVVLDNHLHLLFSSPPSNECTAIINHLRAGVQRDWRKEFKLPDDTQLWEHGFKSRIVGGMEDMRSHLDFIHYDPHRHGLAERPADYKWSSLPARVAQGHYPDNWGVMGPPAGVARVLKMVAATP